jgi:hypothetical protein
VWYLLPSWGGFAQQFAQGVWWIAPGGTPVIGDYNGDGRTDRTVWRGTEGVWSISCGNIRWGSAAAGDVPVLK